MTFRRVFLALSIVALTATTSGCCGGRAPAALSAALDDYSDASPLAAPVPKASAAARKVTTKR